MRQLVPPQQLWNEFQGDLEFEYDHAIYWPAFLKLCEEKHAQYRERWVQAGRHHGESELYLRGGDAQSIKETHPSNTSTPSEKVDEAVPAESTQQASVSTVPVVVSKETSHTGEVQAGDEKKAPMISNGSQANGNLDSMAQVADPILTTEGDRP